MPVQPRLERIWASLGSPEPYQHLGLLSNVVPFSQAAELYRAGGVQHKRMRANYRSCIMLPAVFRTSLWVLDTDCLSALEAAWRHDTAQPQQCPDQAFPLQLHVVKGGVPSSVVAAVEEKMSHWPSSGISMGKVGTVGRYPDVYSRSSTDEVLRRRGTTDTKAGSTKLWPTSRRVACRSDRERSVPAVGVQCRLEPGGASEGVGRVMRV